MVLTETLSQNIVIASYKYAGMQFDWKTFNCVHFVRKVYAEFGIILPLLSHDTLPPREFHLSLDEFMRMPLGHSVFFKRKASMVHRSWTHVAIIIAPHALIHNTRHLGTGVVITPVTEFLETYVLSSCT